MSNKASAQSSRASSPADSGIRKRVGKACDRCRMKKSKCDGATPCGKCKADNSICVYGRRKRSSHDKIYPRGYFEMLEHQQTQLVVGLQELYRRSIQHGQHRDDGLLPETSREKVPMTHDLLSWLGALRQDEHNESDTFHEDFYTMQAVAMLEHPESIKGDVSLKDIIETETDQPQLPTSELAAIRELNSMNLYSSHILRVSPIENTQSLSETSNSLTVSPTLVQLSQNPTRIPWHTEPTEPRLPEFNTYEPWLYDTDVQNTSMYTAQRDIFQQPPETSINPYLTLKDWSMADTYPIGKGFPCTWLA